MLFDLRSRGRRRTVQAVYLGLALLMGGGLVLFGVGAGNGFGGILNAFSGGGGSSAQKQIVSQQEKVALAQTKAEPNNAAAWASLVSARFTNAEQGTNYNSTTGTFTSGGKAELQRMTQDWQQYLKLTKKPDPDVAVLAARGYGQLGDYAGQANAWDLYTLQNPTQPKGFECLAASSYAAKEDRTGDLATAKALSLVPKASRTSLKQTIEAAKTSPSVAQQC
jgi:hypothetical protein